MNAKASARECSHSSVRMEMLPPTMVWNVAPSVPSIERERTVTPRTTPRLRVMRWLVSSNAVVTMSGFNGYLGVSEYVPALCPVRCLRPDQRPHPALRRAPWPRPRGNCTPQWARTHPAPRRRGRGRDVGGSPSYADPPRRDLPLPP